MFHLLVLERASDASPTLEGLTRGLELGIVSNTASTYRVDRGYQSPQSVRRYITAVK